MTPNTRRFPIPKQPKHIPKREERRKQSPFFFVRVSLSSGADTAPRVRVVVSRKVSKKAVQRNKLRRRIKETFRLFVVPSLPSEYDVVIRALPHANTLTFEEIKNELTNLISTR